MTRTRTQSIASAVRSAKALLAEIQAAKATLAEGTASVNEATLARGLDLAAACQFGEDGMAGHATCAAATELLGWVINVTDDAAEVSVLFMYRYISHESCSQFDSLPLTSLTSRRRSSSCITIS